MATVITITGDVLLPNGAGPREGTITYELDGNAQDASGNKVLGRGKIQVPDGGDLDSMSPAPTVVATADLVPATRKYKVTYRLIDEHGTVHAFEEEWSVPASPSSQAIGSLAA